MSWEQDIATFFEQPLQFGGCISDFQSSAATSSGNEVAATNLKNWLYLKIYRP